MRIIISGGGTGGHLFPGIALAQEFKARSLEARILFVGTKKGIEYRTVPAMGYELKLISGAALVGGGPLKKTVGFLQFLFGLFQASAIILTFRPHLVIGTGGYVSAPVLLAACLWGTETAICEQNSVPGLTNRLLGKFVRHIFIAFEESLRFFPSHKTTLAGNPVRREFLAHLQSSERCAGRCCLLVLGGSQGAHSINRSMIDALDTLLPYKEMLAVSHQTGVNDFMWVQQAYREKDVHAEVAPFITDMVSAYDRADLVISRAGAITITELLVCGKPSVLIPYPHAAYNHQEINARALVNHGAAQMLLDDELDGKRLGATFVFSLERPEELLAMAQKAKELARPEAAKAIVDHCYHRYEGRDCHL